MFSFNFVYLIEKNNWMSLLNWQLLKSLFAKLHFVMFMQNVHLPNIC